MRCHHTLGFSALPDDVACALSRYSPAPLAAASPAGMPLIRLIDEVARFVPEPPQPRDLDSPPGAPTPGRPASDMSGVPQARAHAPRQFPRSLPSCFQSRAVQPTRTLLCWHAAHISRVCKPRVTAPKCALDLHRPHSAFSLNHSAIVRFVIFSLWWRRPPSPFPSLGALRGSPPDTVAFRIEWKGAHPPTVCMGMWARSPGMLCMMGAVRCQDHTTKAVKNPNACVCPARLHMHTRSWCACTMRTSLSTSSVPTCAVTTQLAFTKSAQTRPAPASHRRDGFLPTHFPQLASLRVL